MQATKTPVFAGRPESRLWSLTASICTWRICVSWADSKILAEVCVVATLLRADVHDPGHMFAGFIIEEIQRRFWISFDYSQWISGLPKNICSVGKQIDWYVEFKSNLHGACDCCLSLDKELMDLTKSWVYIEKDEGKTNAYRVMMKWDSGQYKCFESLERIEGIFCVG